MRSRSESLARTSVKDEIVELELGHGAFLGFCGGTHVPLVERILGLAPVCSRQDVANRLGAAELVTGSGAREGRLGRVARGLRLPALGWWLGAGLVAVAARAAALIWKLARMDILTIRGQTGPNAKRLTN